MTVEILFGEVCSLSGDGQNAAYLQATLPEAEFIHTPLTQEPYFVKNTPDLIYLGSMSEATQRRVISVLMPYKARLEELIENGTPILATGNAGEVFMQKISYVTEKIETDGLGLLDLTAKTNWFDRYNGKVLGQFQDLKIVGFHAQFSFWYGDNSQNYFLKCLRGEGMHRGSTLEGVRRKNLICTQLLGPILPLNPQFCEYFVGLAGVKAEAAYKEAAMDAYLQRLKEFEDPAVKFGNGI